MQVMIQTVQRMFFVIYFYHKISLLFTMFQNNLRHKLYSKDKHNENATKGTYDTLSTYLDDTDPLVSTVWWC